MKNDNLGATMVCFEESPSSESEDSEEVLSVSFWGGGGKWQGQ